MSPLDALNMVQQGDGEPTSPQAPSSGMSPVQALQMAQDSLSAPKAELPAPTAMDAITGGFKKLGRGLGSIGETALQMGTGMAATPLAGIGSILASPFTEKPTGDVIQSLQHGLTYRPRINEPIGQMVGRVVNAPFDLYNKGVNAASEAVRGNDIGGARDFAGTTLNVLGQAAPAVAGGVRGLMTEPAIPPALNLKQQTLKSAQDLGYVTTPESMGQGSILSGMVAGKARGQQGMSLRNQEITNQVALRDLNSSMSNAQLAPLATDTELTPKILSKVRQDAGQSYADIANQGGRFRVDPQLRADAASILQTANDVQGSFPSAKMPAMNDVAQVASSLVNSPSGFTPSAALTYIKQLRDSARSNLSGSKVTDADRALATAQQSAADALESAMDRAFAAQGKSDLVSKMQSARQVIAKAHTLEDALNGGTGDVSLAQLSKSPYVGPELQKAVDFYDAFSKVNQNPARFGGVQVASPLDAAMSLGGASLGAATGTPGIGMLGSGMVGLRSLALPYLMSKRYQSGLLPSAVSAHSALPLTPGLLYSGRQEQQ